MPVVWADSDEHGWLQSCVVEAALANYFFSIVQLNLGYLEISWCRICIVQDAMDTLDTPMDKSLLKGIHIAIMALNDFIYSSSAILIQTA
jgi:hypothetical protein